MLTYDLTARGNTPIYEYLYRCLRSDILSGALEVGGRLPSRRSFAEHLGVSVITVDAGLQPVGGRGLHKGRAEARLFCLREAHFPAAGCPPSWDSVPEAPLRRAKAGFAFKTA